MRCPSVFTILVTGFLVAFQSTAAGQGNSLKLLGSSPSIPGSTASLQLDLGTEQFSWNSSDTLLGPIILVDVVPQSWSVTDTKLTFVYSDDLRSLVGQVLLGRPNRTVVDLVEGEKRVRYLFKRDPGVLPVANLADLTVDEEAGTAELTLLLGAEPLQPARVDFSCTTGTATDADFDSSPGTIIIPPGRRQVTLAIPLVNDLRVERPEQFTVTLANPERLTIGKGTATVTIDDTDTTVVSIFDAIADEHEFNVRIPIRLSAPSDFVIVVDHDTPSGSAIQMEDFRTRRDNTTFTPGQLEYMWPVALIDDEEVEGNETFPGTLTGVTGERTTLGRAEAAATIIDDESPKEPRVDQIGWQWPNNAVYRPELDYEQYLMTDGTLVLAQNLGHGTAGSTTTVAGIPFINNGAGANNVVGFTGDVNWSVSGPGSTTSDAGIDNLFFSQIESSDAVRLEVDGLDSAKRYVVQLLLGEAGAVDARNWTVDSDLGDFANGNIGGPLSDFVRRQFGQGPLGNSVAAEDPADRRDRRILTFGICGREAFFFENQGWDNKNASLSAFQIREVDSYPRSPDVDTFERIGGLHWTGNQLVAVTDIGEILTGTESLQWTRQDSPVTVSLQDVASARDTLVVVGNRGTILTSDDDGVTWTPRESNTTHTLWGATDIGSRMVVSGNDGTILTSTDFETWTRRPIATQEGLGGGVWNGSLLVLPSAIGTVLVSSDGITFERHVVPGAPSINLNGIVWDGSRFVMVARERPLFGKGLVFSSDGGITWTQGSFLARAALTGLAFNGSLYVTGDQNGSIYTSTDAETWTEQIPVPNDGVRGVVWTGKRFVAGCQNGDFMWSIDGVHWSSQTGVDLPAPLLAGSNYAAWAAHEGLSPGSHRHDFNRDGYPNIFHYALGLSARKVIPPGASGLLPGIDTISYPHEPTVTYRLPAALPSDLRLDVELSTDGRSWRVIASRHGNRPWDPATDHLVVEDDPVGGHRLTRFPQLTANNLQPLALYRLRLSLVP